MVKSLSSLWEQVVKKFPAEDSHHVCRFHLDWLMLVVRDRLNQQKTPAAAAGQPVVEEIKSS